MMSEKERIRARERSREWYAKNKDRAKAYALANREHIAAAAKARRLENPERYAEINRMQWARKKADPVFMAAKRAYCREWGVRNRDRKQEYGRQWREANQERKRIKDAAYRADNPASIRTIKRHWYELNKDHVKAKTKDWVKSNPERRREASSAHGRRAISECRDSYIKHRIKGISGLPVQKIPPEMIGAYREFLKVKRILKEKKA